MSFGMSLVFPDGAFLLSDGAAYQGINLFSVNRKVYVSENGDFALSMRGVGLSNHNLSQKLTSLSDEIGVSDLLKTLPEVIRSFKSRTIYDGHCNDLDAVMVAYIPGVGGVHRAFATYARCASPKHGIDRKVVPYEVFEPSINRFTWPPYYDVWPSVDRRKKTESGESWVRRTAVQIVEYQRFTECTKSTGEPGYFTGGFCDLTSLTADGGKVEQICSWPDLIGEPIDPYRSPTQVNVAPPIAGMNRKQRRARG